MRTHRTLCGGLGSGGLRLLSAALLLLAAAVHVNGNLQNVLYTWETIVKSCGQVINHGVPYANTPEDAKVAVLKAAAEDTPKYAPEFQESCDWLDECLAKATPKLQSNKKNNGDEHSPEKCLHMWRGHVTSKIGIRANFLNSGQPRVLGAGWAEIPDTDAAPAHDVGNALRISKVGITTAASLQEAHLKATERMHDYYGAMLSTMLRESNVCSAERPRLIAVAWIPHAAGAAASIEWRTHMALSHFRMWRGEANAPVTQNACDMTQTDQQVGAGAAPARVGPSGTTELNAEHGPFAAQMMFYCTAKFLEKHHNHDWGEVQAWVLGDN